MDPTMRADRNLIVRSVSPLNAETPPARLIEDRLTPQSLVYLRSHGAVPMLGDGHAVTLDGLVRTPREWTRTALERRFTPVTVDAAMQCAGNRRSDMQHVGRTSGDPWGVGAIANVAWTGVRLVDLLEEAGVDRVRARFIRFIAADEVDVYGEVDRFGVSIPIDKALHPDTLVAWAMNGEPLLPEHGAPLRAVVPGYAGIRSAKWIERIEVSEHPATQPIQARDYKLFPASVSRAEADWEKGLTIDAMPLNAAICLPEDGAVLDEGPVAIRGYAVGNDRAVARVDLSLDGGRSWRQAELDHNADAPWSWTRWAWHGTLPAGEHEIVVRAVDAAGQTQPADVADVWNFAGYLANSWHRIRIRVR